MGWVFLQMIYLRSQMFKRLPIYPIVFSIFPALSLAAHNLHEISLDVMIRPLLVSVLFGIILFGLMKWLLRDWYRAALATFVILLFFFTYGRAYAALEDKTLANIAIFRHRILLPFLGFLLGVLLFVIVKLKRNNDIILWLNLIAVYLLIYPSYQIVSNTIQQWSADRGALATFQKEGNDDTQPDIYYIILDAYGRQDMLRSQLGYDNSEFINALRQRGFYVAGCSQSNYAYTEYSLSSSLNYNYLENIGVDHSRSERVAYLKHSAVRSFLETNGYKVVAFPTGWAFTEWTDADFYLDYAHPATALTEFETLVLDTTPLRILDDFRSLKQSNASRKDLRRLRVLSLLENLKKLPEKNEKLFVFGHIVVPHFPYSFGPNGEVSSFKGEGATYEETGIAYVDQVRFINLEILEVIDTLIAKSKIPPVIILQGDHGPPPDLSFTYAEKMPILNAYYLPGIQKEDVMYPSISPVNTFRVILNSYFGQNLPLLEDRSYFASNNNHDDYYLVPNSCLGKP